MVALDPHQTRLSGSLPLVLSPPPATLCSDKSWRLPTLLLRLIPTRLDDIAPSKTILTSRSTSSLPRRGSRSIHRLTFCERGMGEGGTGIFRPSSGNTGNDRGAGVEGREMARGEGE